MSWERLSVREGHAEKDGPFEGVPSHLFDPLRNWVDHAFGNGNYSTNDIEGGSRLASVIRWVPPLNYAHTTLTVREVTKSLASEPDLMLDAVDAALHLKKTSTVECGKLDEVLSLGGSVWKVNNDGNGLVRRIGAATEAEFKDATSFSDTTSIELKEAWVNTYGRNPNASDAWDHSIKAIESCLIPIVTPSKTKATLGDVVGILNSQGHLWQLSLYDHDGDQSVAPFVSMLRLIWPNPDRHGGTNRRHPSLDESRAVVHLAIMIVQWARAGVLSKRPLAERPFSVQSYAAERAFGTATDEILQASDGEVTRADRGGATCPKTRERRGRMIVSLLTVLILAVARGLPGAPRRVGPLGPHARRVRVRARRRGASPP
ncbi:MAG TPA: hypothetical protein VF070_12140 [Streptosporangiaceae bacterium]